MNPKRLFTAAVRFSGLPWLIRRTYAANKATILLYHDPKPEALDRHLAYLSRRYHFTRLSDVVDAIHTQDWSKVPRRALVLTVDESKVAHQGLAQFDPLNDRGIYVGYDVINSE